MDPTVLILLVVIVSILAINRSSYLQGNSRAASQIVCKEKGKHWRVLKLGAFWGRKTFVPCWQKIFVVQCWWCGQHINKIAMVVVKLLYVCLIR